MVLHGKFNKETKMILNLTNEQLNIIGVALQELPFKVSSSVIAEISKQIQQSHDAQVDAHDMPSGQTKPKDEYSGD